MDSTGTMFFFTNNEICIINIVLTFITKINSNLYTNVKRAIHYMENYGSLMKKLIKFTNVKLSTIADAAGYDVSYISKWCNQSKLPAARVSGVINKNLAKIFSNEIILQGELENFCNEFNVVVSEEQLVNYLYTALKDSFKKTQANNDKQTRKNVEQQSRIFYNPAEITSFFEGELLEAIHSLPEPVEILCTIDICELLQSQHGSSDVLDARKNIHVRLGLNPNIMNYKRYLDLYYLINKYHWVSFDFYDNTNFDQQNMIVIKDLAAIMCSMDNHGKITTICVINDPVIVSTLYMRTLSLFKIHHLLIMSATSEELNLNGYRSNFYAFDDYQIFLVRGFEYLLPPNIIEKIVKSAYEQGYDSSTEKILRTLFARWDEIAYNGKMDFFFTKSSLLKYVDDGEFYFTDIKYNMEIEERKEHINHVLKIAKTNPNINFYVIDDEDIPYPHHLILFSIFNNRSKLFLKNTVRFRGDDGPQFYTIMNENMISEIGKCYEAVKKLDFCRHFPAVTLEDFMNQYGAMVYRMLSLSEIKTVYKKA